MSKLDLIKIAETLPDAWRSHIVGTVGPTRLKVLRMDALPYAEEVHQHGEALLVLDGRLELSVAGTRWTIESGEIFIVAAGTPHAVCAGSHGTLFIASL